MIEDNPDWQVFMNLLSGLYHNHPIRTGVAGTVESISHITPELLYRCYNRYYNLHNMVLVVAGNITPEEVEQTADRLLKPSEEFVPVPYTCDEPATVKEEYVECSMPVASPLFYIAFKEPVQEQNAESLAAARVLTELMAGKSSPLYTRLMDEGLINDQFEVEYFSGPGYGLWLFGGESADPKRVQAIVKEEIARMQKEGIDPAAAEAVRRGAYGRLVAGLDDPTDCAELILGNLLDGIEPLEELTALKDLTVETLQEQLRRRIPVDASSLSVVNPV